MGVARSYGGAVRQCTTSSSSSPTDKSSPTTMTTQSHGLSCPLLSSPLLLILGVIDVTDGEPLFTNLVYPPLLATKSISPLPHWLE
ncbi:hypothetical protein TcWFU_005009 [Taenia crassiceps]|uniref:Uncharacterized protein n=1 Tax=Taenia crassiceps TaxID=6207 RepID=A0ABR4Q216_9CEST